MWVLLIADRHGAPQRQALGGREKAIHHAVKAIPLKPRAPKFVDWLIQLEPHSYFSVKQLCQLVIAPAVFDMAIHIARFVERRAVIIQHIFETSLGQSISAQNALKALQIGGGDHISRAGKRVTFGEHLAVLPFLPPPMQL